MVGCIPQSCVKLGNYVIRSVKWFGHNGPKFPVSPDDYVLTLKSVL